MPLEITRTQQADRYGRNGETILEVMVTYYLSERDGPYTMRFPAGTSGDDMRRRIDEHARELERLRRA